jgi:hypothetical protein
MKIKPRHIESKNRFVKNRGFGKPFDSQKKDKNFFRVEYIFDNNGNETYFAPMWYEVRDFAPMEKRKLLQGLKSYIPEDVTINESFVFLAVAMLLDSYRGKEGMPNMAFIYPPVKDKDEIIRYPIAQFNDNGKPFLSLKSDDLLVIAVKKSVFTEDKLVRL